MIASLSGIVKGISTSSAIVEVGGVGILVNLSPRVVAGLHVGSHVSFHTTLLVREDSLTLFGFEDTKSKELFELLQTVTGIGPKVAQSALSVYDAPEIAAAIRSENGGILERIPGLGKKGAARVLLELKDKVSHFGESPASGKSLTFTWRDQIEGALLNLGFTQRDCLETLDILAEEISHSDEKEEIGALLRRALQIHGRSS